VVFVTARLVDPASGKPVGPKSADEKNPLQAKLDAIVIPQIQFHEATLSEAVEFLRRKSLDLDTTTTDPNQKGVNMIVKAGGNTPEARITLDLKNIPLGEALRYLAQLSGLQLVVEPHAVLLLSLADFEARQKQVESSAPNKPGMVITAESISIDKGTGVVDASGDVKIKTSQGTISTEQAKVETKPSAGEVILPKVQFHEATLTEAVEFLRVKSRELDPEKKGLNILVKPGGDPKAKITMELKDVPAYEALRYVAEIAGCKLTVEGDVFVIAPTEATR
jgi:type II secretory pathway component HofQ